MSHVFSALAGAALAIAAMKTSVAEPGWGFLFPGAFIAAVIGWCAERIND